MNSTPLSATAGVEHFDREAGAVHPGWRLDEETRPLVLELVELLDGNPAALTVAARRLRTLPLSALVELAQEPSSLMAGTAVGDEVLDAWTSLEDELRHAAVTLAWLRGEFSADTAQELTGLSPLALSGMLEGLLDLGLFRLGSQPGRFRPVRLASGVARGLSEAPASLDTYLSWVLAAGADKSEADVLHALDLATRSQRPSMAVDLACTYARLAERRQRAERGLQVLDATASGLTLSDELSGRLWLERARLHRSCDDQVAQGLACERAIELLPPGSDRRRARLLLAALKWRQGATAVAHGAYDRLVQEARAASDLELEFTVEAERALTLHSTGHVERALEHYDRSLVLATRLGRERALLTARVNRADLLIGLGHLEAARSVLERAEETARVEGYPAVVARVRVSLGELLRRAGRHEEAIEWFHEALDTLTDHPDALCRALAESTLCELSVAAGDLATARRWLAAAEKAGAEIGAAELAAQLQRARASVATAEGLIQPARASLRRADDLLSAAGYTLELWHHRFCWLEFEQSVGDRQRAAELLADLERDIPADHPSCATLRARWAFFAGRQRALRISADGRDCEWEGVHIGLSRKPLQRRLFGALVRAHQETPGRPVDIFELIEAGWPDSRLPPQTLTNRAYVTLHALRRGGFRSLIETSGGGYRLAEGVPVLVGDVLDPGLGATTPSPAPARARPKKN